MIFEVSWNEPATVFGVRERRAVKVRARTRLDAKNLGRAKADYRAYGFKVRRVRTGRKASREQLELQAGTPGQRPQCCKLWIPSHRGDWDQDLADGFELLGIYMLSLQGRDLAPEDLANAYIARLAA